MGGVRPGGLALAPGPGFLDVERIFAVPRLLGPAIAGVTSDTDGFIVAGQDGRVAGARKVWAAGDGIVSPVKFGGARHPSGAPRRGRVRAARGGD